MGRRNDEQTSSEKIGCRNCFQLVRNQGQKSLRVKSKTRLGKMIIEVLHSKDTAIHIYQGYLYKHRCSKDSVPVPVVPHKAVAEVSRPETSCSRSLCIMDGRAATLLDRQNLGLSGCPSSCLFYKSTHQFFFYCLFMCSSAYLSIYLSIRSSFYSSP